MIFPNLSNFPNFLNLPLEIDRRFSHCRDCCLWEVAGPRLAVGKGRAFEPRTAITTRTVSSIEDIANLHSQTDAFCLSGAECVREVEIADAVAGEGQIFVLAIGEILLADVACRESCSESVSVEVDECAGRDCGRVGYGCASAREGYAVDIIDVIFDEILAQSCISA